MAQPNLIEVFNDCVQRLNSGESLEQCLSRYPAFADQIRPMLETVITLRTLPISQAEVYQDKAIVWDMLQSRIAQQGKASAPRMRAPVQLLAAVFILMLMASISWFVLNRLNLPSDPNVIGPLATAETMSPSPSPTRTATPIPTSTATARMSSSPSMTASPTPTPTATATVSPNPSSTRTATSRASDTPAAVIPFTATFAPGCGAAFNAEAASARVLEIYPNTTITSVTQMEKFGGTLVWEVRTSHQIIVTIDVACGTVLTIDRVGSGPAATSVTAGSENFNDNAVGGSAGTNDNNVNSGSIDNENDNSNEPEDSNDNEDSGSGMGSDD